MNDKRFKSSWQQFYLISQRLGVGIASKLTNVNIRAYYISVLVSSPFLVDVTAETRHIKLRSSSTGKCAYI
jgi:hypothetical protein